jgi:hypothetical protein
MSGTYIKLFLRCGSLNDPIPFLHFWNYLPLEKQLSFDLNNFEFPLPNDNLYKVHWNWCAGSRESFFFSFLFFCYYLPLDKGISLHMNNSESPLPNNDLCQHWLQLVQQFWRRSQECTFLTDRRTDLRCPIGDQKKLTWDFNSGDVKPLHKNKN